MGATTVTSLCICLSLVLLSLLHTTTFATEKRSYVVYMGAHSHGQSVSSADLDRVTESHYMFLQSFLAKTEEAKDAIFYSYTRHINGFAATLDDEAAARIARHPHAVSVFLNKGRKLHTTRSWEFMGLEDDDVILPGLMWEKARFGEDASIGNLDTGVWPESMSFSDEGLGPVPSKRKGICQNDVDSGFHCNSSEFDRILTYISYHEGSWLEQDILTKGMLLQLDLLIRPKTLRDAGGQGSRTLSTAGGSFVPRASVFDFGNGTAKDILAAFDVSIDDGVDVLSVSLGNDDVGFFNDSVAIGSFHAVKHGIFVVCAAGNSGPNASTVANVAPWQFRVGASIMDRQFPNYVTLGNKIQFKGESLSIKALPSKDFYPIIQSKDVKAVVFKANNQSI
ncbi:hypothetical protein AgCh_003163 [Apium graveolens]